MWKKRTQELLKTIKFDFFPDGIMTELCEKPPQECNDDQQTFKTYLSRWMAMTVQMAPFTESTIMPLLESSAEAAMQQCSGNFFPGNCGLRWSLKANWDGVNGPGEQMAALSVLLSTIKATPPPLTNSTGGTSVSDPSAGQNITDILDGTGIAPATQGGRVGAWILTVLILGSIIAGCYFLWSPSWELRSGSLYSGGPSTRNGFFASMSGALSSSPRAEKSLSHSGLMSS